MCGGGGGGADPNQLKMLHLLSIRSAAQRGAHTIDGSGGGDGDGGESSPTTFPEIECQPSDTVCVISLIGLA